MTRGDLAAALQRYRTAWPEESATVNRFDALLEYWPECLERFHLPGHLTASAWVVDPAGTAVVLTHHRKLNKWLQLGGHVDGDSDILGAARREVVEESGITAFDRIEDEAIFDLDVHRIPPYGEMPEHDHYDIRFLFVAAGRITPSVSDESHDVAWIPVSALEEYTTERSMVRMRDKWLRQR